jgi:putative transposase
VEDLLMKKKRFSLEQIVGVLKQAEVGVPVVELIRKAGISEQTFYRWKAKYVGLEVDQVRQMSQLCRLSLTLLFFVESHTIPFGIMILKLVVRPIFCTSLIVSVEGP